MFALPLLCATALLRTAIQTSSESNFNRIVGQATGRNGYEEYLRASDLVHDGMFEVYRDWSPNAVRTEDLTDGDPATRAERRRRRELATSLANADLLSVYQAAVGRYGRAIEFLEQGNAKPVFDPRPEFTADTLFPEFSDFRRLSRLIVMRAYVQRAGGDANGAVKTLLNGLTFSRRIAGSTIIGDMVGVANASVILADFEEGLPTISLPEARLVRDYVDAALAEPFSFTHVIENERHAHLAAFETATQDPKSLEAVLVNEVDLPLRQRLERLNPGETNRLITTAKRLLEAKFTGMLTTANRPENELASATAGWDDAASPRPTAQSSLENLAAAIVDNLQANYRGFVIADLKSRTQLRLLGLHARIIEYRWRNRHLPARLSDAVPQESQYDPFANAAFVYERHPNGDYRLFSKGNPETGPIELKYHRPQASGPALP